MSRDQLRTSSFWANGTGLNNQITNIMLKRWPTNNVSGTKSCNFHFHKNDFTWLLSANGLFNLLSQSLVNLLQFRKSLNWDPEKALLNESREFSRQSQASLSPG